MSPTDDLLDPLLGPWLKGFPHAEPPLRRSAVPAQRWNLWAGDLPLPLAVVSSGALRHNLAWMQAFARDRGLELAPHGKTTMSPQLFRAQLDHGAWGMTVATLAQLRVAVDSGARRVVVANQVLQRADLIELDRLLRVTPGLRVLFLLDSPAQLQAIERLHLPSVFEVLLELGTSGGRTGVRGHEAAVQLARQAHASPAVRLAGVECYEGLKVQGEDDADHLATRGWMERMRSLAVQLADEGLFDSDEVVVSAGGSGVFDFVAQGLQQIRSHTALAGRPVVGVLRSGCYVTHDHGRYQRLVSAIDRRIGCDRGLQGALEVWAVVQSVPEPGLALLSAGRRDLSYDIEMPIPLRWCPQGQRQPRAAGAAWQVTGLNDQHAHLRLGDDAAGLCVGDRVALGISHPCTTFDKWRWMAVIDEEGFVVDALITCF